MGHREARGRTRRHVYAVLAAAALAAAGCGGGSGDDKQDYVKAVDGVGRTLQQELSSLGTDISAQSDPRGIARKLEDGARTLDDAAAKLEDIDPPDDAEAAHRQIVAGIHRLAQSFQTGEQQARAGKLTELVKTFGGIADSPGIREIARGTKALKAAGYDIE